MQSRHFEILNNKFGIILFDIRKSYKIGLLISFWKKNVKGFLIEVEFLFIRFTIGYIK